MYATKDYTGQKFGKLTAISATGASSRSRRVWRFQCECGRFVERAADNVITSLRNGNIPACDVCCRHSVPPKVEPVRLEITGQRFGRLTALEPTGRVNSRRYAIWRFQCDCGAIVERVGGHVVQNAKRQRSIPSCGSFDCRGSGKARRPNGVSGRNRLASAYRRSAQARNLAFELSDERLDALFQGPCHYCGAEPSQVSITRKSRSAPFVYNGIDRLDNSRGYVEGNVVSCCGRCNRAKGTMSREEFLAWVERVHAHNQ